MGELALTATFVAPRRPHVVLRLVDALKLVGNQRADVTVVVFVRRLIFLVLRRPPSSLPPGTSASSSAQTLPKWLAREDWVSRRWDWSSLIAGGVAIGCGDDDWVGGGRTGGRPREYTTQLALAQRHARIAIQPDDDHGRVAMFAPKPMAVEPGWGGIRENDEATRITSIPLSCLL
ncbi:hypothetical protein FIBSPDRAFT_879267 [Athelia psychrophila]|uniref:Uncharacterized protein n=1 Tax=Athelia psychrophila TaxID=1759441 RepID=A0A167U6P2_9AGAM|nr:hypothetical protein FIBSPDRAFT_879267 [Fibularhizoctonia sp. CBS 109695]